MMLNEYKNEIKKRRTFSHFKQIKKVEEQEEGAATNLFVD